MYLPCISGLADFLDALASLAFKLSLSEWVREYRDAPQIKKRENVGIFPQWGAPPPLPPVWEPHVCEKKLWFILHFRTLGTFLVFTKMFTFLAGIMVSRSGNGCPHPHPHPLWEQFPLYPVFFDFFTE